ncbi:MULTISPECIES: hypothetical protein [Ekhidna]|jgi:signal transduction histidine kinase|uniref:DUF2281 domain-containing protein n=1 Tax=Ekhidna lutea TaxID=447679 RepID=A0A239GRD2_EKHLU|nr:hypothetical protein [Ekhidna lutea]SNS71511.1 hypothetical protein SAMN05421640_0965 [Ekhidna lutea]
MSRKELIEETLKSLDKLSDTEVEEVKRFAELLRSKIEDQELSEGIMNLSSKSEAFDFLKEEEDLYSEEDLIEKY